MIFEIDIFSPRWGHDDKYTLDFTQEIMTFKQKNGKLPLAILKYVEGRDPEWNDVKNLFKMLNNDNIYPPHILPSLIEHIWFKWRDGEMDADTIQSELNALAKYVNDSTKAKPVTDFWRGYF